MSAQNAFGRNAPETRPSRLGRRSILFAIGTLLLVIIAFTIALNLPRQADGTDSDIGIMVAMGVFLIAAPILHLAGALFGIAAFFKDNDNKLLGALGFVLNIALLGAGGAAFYFFLGAATAFT